MFTGICYAFSKEPLPEGYFDGIALVENDAADMAFETNVQRKVAAEKAKHGFGE